MVNRSVGHDAPRDTAQALRSRSTEGSAAVAIAKPKRPIRTIVIYAALSQQMICFCLYPLLISRGYRIQLIGRTGNSEQDLSRITRAGGDLLICAGILKGLHGLNPEIVQLLQSARRHFSLIYYLDDQDSTAIHSGPYMALFDKWLKKQIYANSLDYKRHFLGGRIYTDAFCRQQDYVAESAKTIPPLSDEQIASIDLAWSICIGVYPIALTGKLFALFRILPLPLGRGLLIAYHQLSLLTLALRLTRWRLVTLPRQAICLARFNESGYRDSIGFQRRLFRTLCQDNPGLFAAQKVNGRRYQRELFQAAACLSPFGWGEVCYRDAEAIRAGALLVKPSMDLLRTWPDLYAPPTCLSIDWDGRTLRPAVAGLLEDRTQWRRRRLDAGLALLRANLALPARVREVIEGQAGPLPPAITCHSRADTCSR